MATRNILHIKHLPAFKEWLISQGWEIQPLSNHGFEQLRAKKDKQTLIIYKRMNAKEHLTYMDKDWRVVKDFFKAYKGE